MPTTGIGPTAAGVVPCRPSVARAGSAGRAARVTGLLLFGFGFGFGFDGIVIGQGEVPPSQPVPFLVPVSFPQAGPFPKPALYRQQSANYGRRLVILN